MKSPPIVLEEIGRMNKRLEEQAQQIAGLQSALKIQFTRIAQMQAELDVLPTARERRMTIRALLQPTTRPSAYNGNGRSDG